jgi:hypothetical protein
MALKLFACLILLSAPLAAQTTPKSIALTGRSNVSSGDILKSMRSRCPNVSIVDEAANSDYALDAIRTKARQPLGIVPEVSFDLTLFDHDGRTFYSASTESLGGAVKGLCHAIKTFLMVDVVDTENLTQSTDVRGDTSGGAARAVVNATTGRRTHTDSTTIKVIVNGEHALMDCYERSTGCATLGPGKYYGELRGDGIWLTYRMPLTHEQVRNHYKIAGSW